MKKIKYTYNTDWIHMLESKKQWILYWNQQKIMENKVKAGDHVLEIGLGSGFTANYLRSKGVKVTTIDIDEGKNPDITANIANYKFKEHYDHLLAFEVFEHIPYHEFEKVVSKLVHSIKGCLFISLPRNVNTLVCAELRLPVIKTFGFQIIIPKWEIDEKNHFWELDYKQYTVKRLVNMIEQRGFKLEQKKKVLTYYFLSFKNTTTK